MTYTSPLNTALVISDANPAIKNLKMQRYPYLVKTGLFLDPTEILRSEVSIGEESTF